MILVTPRPAPEAPHRLVVLPHAGGGPTFYRDWGAAAGPDVEVRIAQYPGRERRLAEAPVSEARVLVDEVCAALRASDDGRPTALFGHSMGAILAHETAHALAAGGPVRPSALFVSGRPAPAAAPPGPPPGATARPRTDAEILESLRRHGGTPMELFDHPDMRELFFPVLRADYLLVDSYRPAPDRAPLDLPVTALWGTRDPVADERTMLPWRSVTIGAFGAYGFTGGHFYLTEHRDAVLDRIRAGLGLPVRRG